ncbi:MAG: outer membrane protein assembly factor BamC [Gammaproteobacteria bacterium]
MTVVLAVGVLAGCSTISNMLPGDKTDYQHSRATKALDVPPDLSSSELGDSMVVPGAESSGTATYSEYERAGSGGAKAGAAGQSDQVLPPQKGIKVVRDGDRQWLVVDGTPDQVWPKVRDFWLHNGFELTTEERQIGIMQTNWAENRADIPEGPIRSFLTKYLGQLYSSPTRDRFRVRVERGTDAGTTDVYLTHQGMQQVESGGTVSSEDLTWTPRPPDPGLDAEMTKRLMVYLGVAKARASELTAKPQVQAPKATLGKDGQGRTVLVVDEGFRRAWGSAGIVLDRVGFMVQDQDRSKGVYYVRYDDPAAAQKKESWLSKLAFWKSAPPPSSDQYQVKLTAQGDKTEVTVLDKSGARDDSDTARRILNLMYEQFK